MEKKAWIAELISAVLLLLFLYAAISKLAEHSRFESVLRMAALTQGLSVAVSWGIPAAELLVCVLLFLPGTRKTGMGLSFLLLTVMTGYLVFMLLYAPELPCNCGGVIARMNWMQHIWFNLFFMGLSVTGFLLVKHKRLT